ncbi:MAG: bifunctional 5,10-methylenetetrahydrofolate dehydrogenase/5,10-methenyltetrahydrofolate cyclohydrolase [Alphaproteobacteria bacterium]|nr:bifunctional 5,10-methylenetetrahydrofolate dehydrogenase/5,10-methenyltetrahydrofolate cyclohydrolase [Alphaproteobacteria bacterium]
MKDPRYLDGRELANSILENVSREWTELSKTRTAGKLVSIAIGNVAEIEVYIRGQKRAAEKAGIGFEEQHWPEDITQDDSKSRILAMNDDPSVVGIILQRPVPDHINVRSLQSAIHPLKDVEGMNPASIGNIVYDDLALSPCTAAASVELIKATGLDLHGLEVVIIGHSAIVGKPAAFLLMAEGATVTVCHHMTRSVASHSRRADAVLVAVGIAGFLTADMVKPGSAVIDIGINQVTDADGTSRIVGDADTENVKEVASWITPVPGGVGPVTVSKLMENALVAWKRQIELGWVN